MKDRFLFLFSLLGSLVAFAPTTFAQAADLITSIDGDSDFQSDVAIRYFNRDNCGLGGSGGTGGIGGTGGSGGSAGASGAGGSGGTGGVGGGVSASTVPKGSPATTPFQIRLEETGQMNTVYLWVGRENAGCEIGENRDVTRAACGEIAGNPQSVGNNFTVSLFLQDLLDAKAGTTDIVSCETSGLTGTPYEIFVFRVAPPPTGIVEPANYGIAPFTVDVEPPNAPLINTTSQEASSFNITWGEPNPTDLIQSWTFSSAPTNDPTAAVDLGITASLSARSQRITSEQLGLANNESAYVFMNAYDQAFVSDPLGGNKSVLSPGVMVTSVPVEGFCDQPGIDCSGCSASPMHVAGGQGPNSIAWVLGALCAMAYVRRRRR